MDRKEIIKGLKDIQKHLETGYSFAISWESELIHEAIVLLKEQDSVEPIPYHRSDGTIFKYECRQCRTKIFKMDLFCRHCGRAVKWNE